MVEVQTHQEATVYVKELDIFLTRKVLEDTSVVLSLGKLCDEHGYSYEWINRQKRFPDTMQHGELRADRGSWFINEFFFRFAVCNIDDTFKARNWSSYVVLKLVYQPWNLRLYQAVVRLEHEKSCLGQIPILQLCQVNMLKKQDRWDPCSSEIPEEQLLTETTNIPNQRNEDHDQ